MLSKSLWHGYLGPRTCSREYVCEEGDKIELREVMECVRGTDIYCTENLVISMRS